MSNTYEKIRNEVVAGGGVDEADVTAGGSRAVIGIGVLLGLLVWLALVNIWTFVFLVGLLASIFLHEVGHFVTARWSDIKVTQFFMGMGPRLWSFKRGEVEYGVRALPVGAFVRMIGMNNLDETPPEDEARAFRNKSYPRRLLTITAGSLMHMLIAVVLLFTIYAGWGKRVGTGEVSFAAVDTSSPAGLAGVQLDDRIISADGRPITAADQLAPLVQAHSAGDVIALTILRNGQTIDLSVVLGESPDPAKPGKGYLGVRSSERADYQTLPLPSAISHSFTDLGSSAWASVGGVVTVMNPVNIIHHLTGADQDQTTQPVTAVGVTRFSGAIGKEAGLPGILMMLAGVNVFVGLINMFPLLPFDGGHAAIATYERIRSRRGKLYRADVAKMIPLTMAVMGFLIFVMMSGLYLDFTNPIR